MVDGISNFVVLKKTDDTEATDQTIVNYLMSSDQADNYVHFIAVGNVGSDFTEHKEKKYLGSVSGGIIKNSNLNVIFFS